MELILFLLIGFLILRPLFSKLSNIRKGKYTKKGRSILVVLAVIGFICGIFSGAFALILGGAIALFFFVLFSKF